jgi:hypothetical protein
MSDVEEEGIDYNADLQWASDTESDARLVEVSEKTRRFLAERFTQRVPNSTRLATRRQFPLPKVPATRTPQLDQVIRGEVSSSVKTGDKELAKIQTYLFDAVAPQCWNVLKRLIRIPLQRCLQPYNCLVMLVPSCPT